MDHLNERTMEQLRTHTLSHPELERAKGHLHSCPICKARYEAAAELQERLAKLALEEPSADFTRMVLSRLDTALVQEQIHSAPAAARPVWFRPEIANGLVATAATYAFLSSGILKAVFSLGQGALGPQVYAKAQLVVDWVDQLSQVLH